MLLAAGALLTLALQSAQTAPAGLADAYYFFIQGRTLEGKGDVAGAIAAYKRAAELEPKVSTIHAEMAGLYARAGRAADAISEAELALTLDATDREAHRILGLVQAALADNLRPSARQTELVTQAIGHLEKALDGARDPGAELTLGRLEVRTGRYTDAVNVLRNFLLDNPGYPEGVMLLAEAYERSGNEAAVIDTLKPVYDALVEATADPQASAEDKEFFVYVAMSLANAYQAHGDAAGTERVLRAVIARDPKNDVALNALGYFFAERGEQLPEAASLVERALAVQPESASYLDSLGWVYFKQGRIADAIPPLERATKIAEFSSLLQAHLAEAYFAAKRYRDAADAWTRALAGDRDSIDVDVVTAKRDKARALIK
jgi:tetratricopeptide (TPR) repeat protein